MPTDADGHEIVDNMDDLLGWLGDYKYITEMCIPLAASTGSVIEPPVLRVQQNVLDQAIDNGWAEEVDGQVRMTDAGWNKHIELHMPKKGSDMGMNSRTKYHGWSNHPW